MSQDKRHKPRTGTGEKARGKKPTEVGILQMRHTRGQFHSVPASDQPKGWGIAKVINLFRS